MKTRWLERQDTYLFAHHQSVVLMDLLMARDVKPDFFLRKTGLFYEDVSSGSKKLSPEQFAQLCDNASQPPHAADVSFLFGQRMLPGYFGCYSSALQNAPTLRHALHLLVEFSILFFPLLSPMLRQSKNRMYIDFRPNFGEFSTSLLSSSTSRPSRFIKEMTVTAITSLTTWLAKENLPWMFDFDFPEPDYQSEYDVFLGNDRHFLKTYTSMSIAESYLDKPWTMSSKTIYQMALEESRQAFLKLNAQQSLLAVINDMLNSDIQHLPSLEAMADILDISPATLKRKLKTHNTSYQKLCDKVRKRISINLINDLDYNEGQVAEYLNFYDVSNFRRSFKRWLAY
ncbi:AraC family transcriptional regulator [Marinomonas transparens]|uniref:AraC family transcriptional regulator ligand-binding domain-containing protein n=1 Tax=Marinomonas transparens TaxID=2795388 RepID=A0A934N030_9GAMM|nr:AraC family transcriptional regulator [Marinomonas transparens]MBJ7536302.1 AraC family transcriptional regulator ligand-binding domain-containing protein [Marinomonas transparens]